MADFCPQCGAPIESGDKFCNACGAKLNEPENIVSPEVQRTWRSTTAGILSILAGVTGIVIVPSLVISEFGLAGDIVFWIAFLVQMALGIPAIIGGICSLRRRGWKVAEAGSICAFLCLWPLGIPAIIFTHIGKKEFR